MEIIGIETPLIHPNDELTDVLLNSLESKRIRDGDVIVVASSVVSLTSGEIRDPRDVKPGKLASELSERSGLDERFVEVIIRDADRVLGAGKKCILTLKDGMIKINAGADRSNVPNGKILLLPDDPEESADEIRKRIEERTGKEVGVVISDSHVNPLRRGTTGQSIGSSGINAALDCRNRTDLYGRGLQMTFRALGDQIASSAQLAMGESDERVPFVIVRGVEDAFSDKPTENPKIPPEKCAYSSVFDYSGKQLDMED